MKIRLPKWATVVGGLVAIAPSLPALKQSIPFLQHNPTFDAIVTIVGAIVAMYGTPIHANTPAGGVLQPGEPPIDHPAA